MSQSVRDSQPGLTAGLKGWMNGCMSVEEMSVFSYQVAVGKMTSEYSGVVVMRKSRLTSRSSLPSVISGRTLISSGCAAICSCSYTPCLVPSRYLKKYSEPFAEEPSRLARHTMRLRGKFSGASGSA